MYMCIHIILQHRNFKFCACRLILVYTQTNLNYLLYKHALTSNFRGTNHATQRTYENSATHAAQIRWALFGKQIRAAHARDAVDMT